MQRFIKFLFGSDHNAPEDTFREAPSRPMPAQKGGSGYGEDEATRPSYRVSKHKHETSELRRVIDISANSPVRQPGRCPSARQQGDRIAPTK